MTVTYADIQAASARISGHAIRTPLISHPALDDVAGGKVFIKPENLQYSGSFKFRGAFNRLSQLTAKEAAIGVVAWSSGNHAQGVAAAAQILGIPATIVMPSDAPLVKLAGTREYGAEIVLYNRYEESREDIARKLASDRGAVLVPSFEDGHIIAGQGTCGLELMDQLEDLHERIDQLLVCCGGGGLIAGTSLAIKQRDPTIKVYSVEPKNFDDHARSLISGQLEVNSPSARSICDALLAPSPGRMTFDINQKTLAAGLTVSDDEVKEAIKFAYSTLKLVVEPGGAVALAAVLSNKVATKNRSTAIVVSGGNVDPVLFSECIA